MNIHKLYVFVDTPKRICFSQFGAIEKLPKPTINWVQITTEAFEQIKHELPQPALLVSEIEDGIKKDGFWVVDFADYSTLLKYLVQDWSEKWDRYITLEVKIVEEKQKGFVDPDLHNDFIKAQRDVMEALDKWVGLIKGRIKNKK